MNIDDACVINCATCPGAIVDMPVRIERIASLKIIIGKIVALVNPSFCACGKFSAAR